MKCTYYILITESLLLVGDDSTIIYFREFKIDSSSRSYDAQVLLPQ